MIHVTHTTHTHSTRTHPAPPHTHTQHPHTASTHSTHTHPAPTHTALAHTQHSHTHTLVRRSSSHPRGWVGPCGPGVRRFCCVVSFVINNNRPPGLPALLRAALPERWWG